jgi:glycolate oxidase
MSDHKEYGAVTKAVLQRLVDAVGNDNVRTDSDARHTYAHDETEDLSFQPEVVVFPTSTAAVSTVMRIAHEHTIPVTPRGGGTGLSGGALPIHGGIVLSIEHMDTIIDIDADNLMAVVEPGVITQILQEETEKLGLYYPPDPSSRGSSRLAGNLAESAGGPHAVKYGVTKDYVMGVEAVLADGTVVHHGGKLLKNATGYNITQLMIGSEGTHGIITKIYLKLIPLPKRRIMLSVPFPTLEKAAKTVPAIMNAGITPSVLEFMERDAIKVCEEHTSTSVPHSDAAAQLLIEIDGDDDAAIQSTAERVCEIALEQGATDVLLAESSTKQQELWRMRRAAGEAVKSLSIYKEEDTVVPRHNIVPLLKGVKEIAARYGIRTICYGHAGDGNLHVNILKMDMSDEEWESNLDPAIVEIFELTVSLGGTISGEHGIGYSQKNYMPIAFAKEEIDLMRRIKHAFDPKGILNPGKIFPDEK